MDVQSIVSAAEIKIVIGHVAGNMKKTGTHKNQQKPDQAKFAVVPPCKGRAQKDSSYGDREERQAQEKQDGF